jgi:hypothetical protein
MEAIVCGLLGAALGVGLYRLGWYAARRTPKRTEGEKAAMPTLPMTEQEWYNFLHYDGSEQEVE